MRGFRGRALFTALLVFGLVGATFGVAQAALSADLQISITDSPDPVTDGALVRYRIAVENPGPNGAIITVNFDLPSGGTITNVTSAGGGTCTGSSTAGTCVGSRPLRPGRTAIIDVYVQAALPGPNALHATVTGNRTDPNLTNNEATESSTVMPQGDSVTGFIPPGGGSISTCPGGAPTDPNETCATLIATGGPGGPVTITEDAGGVSGCVQTHCLGSAVDVVPPPGYEDGGLLLLLDYDVTELPSGNGVALVEKDGVTSVIPPCSDGHSLPCVQAKGRIEGGDYRFAIQIGSIDPKFQGKSR